MTEFRTRRDGRKYPLRKVNVANNDMDYYRRFSESRYDEIQEAKKTTRVTPGSCDRTARAIKRKVKGAEIVEGEISFGQSKIPHCWNKVDGKHFDVHLDELGDTNEDYYVRKKK